VIATVYVSDRRGWSLRLAAWWLAVVVALAISQPTAAEPERDMTFQEYSQTMEQTSGYFMKLYKDLGLRVRYAAILEKCGYKKEADELDAGTGATEKTLLDRLTLDGIDSHKLPPSFAAIALARESARGMMIGYRLGYRESFNAMSDTLAARDYESLCKSTLRKAREVMQEADPK
jgi:hypothetical protein